MKINLLVDKKDGSSKLGVKEAIAFFPLFSVIMPSKLCKIYYDK